MTGLQALGPLFYAGCGPSGLFGERIAQKKKRRKKRRDRSLVTQDTLSLRRRRREAVVVAILGIARQKPGL